MRSDPVFTSPNSPKVLAFGRFEFDSRSLELRLDGDIIPLKPQPAKFLAALLHAAPEFVARDELIEILWPDGRVVEFDQGLNSCARQVRRALETEAGGASLIETLPRRGYRFGGRTQAQAATRTAQRRSGLARYAVLSLAMIAAAALALTWVRAPADPAVEVTDVETLLQARFGLAEGNTESVEAAREAYARILTAVPTNSEARGGFVLATALLAGRPGHDWEDRTGQAEALSEAILRDNPNQVETLTALAYVTYYRDWNVSAARALVDRALAVDPERDLVLSLASAVYAGQGESRAAAEFADRAALANPQSMSVRSDRCWYHVFDRNGEAALRACNWALRLDPGNVSANLGRIEALLIQNDREAATRMLAALVEQDQDLGLEGLSCALAERLDSSSPNQRSAIVAAASALRCGNRQAAIQHLGAALESRESGALFIGVDPRFDGLRSSPAVVAIEREKQASEGLRS